MAVVNSTTVYKYLFETLLSVVVGVYLDVRLLGHVVILCMTL